MFGDEEMNNKYVVRLFYFLIIYFFYFLPEEFAKHLLWTKKKMYLE